MRSGQPSQLVPGADVRDAGAPTRILNVNDNEQARYMVSHVLKRAGFDVSEARTGAEAIQRAKADRPALVILDIRLPDATGFDVCRRLREDPDTQAVKVLYSSATSKSFDEQIRKLEGGADGYLPQPYEPEQLVDTIRGLLQSTAAAPVARHDAA